MKLKKIKKTHKHIDDQQKTQQFMSALKSLK